MEVWIRICHPHDIQLVPCTPGGLAGSASTAHPVPQEPAVTVTVTKPLRAQDTGREAGRGGRADCGDCVHFTFHCILLLFTHPASLLADFF